VWRSNTKIPVSSVSLNDFPAPPAKPTVYVVGSETLPEGLLDVYPKWARRFGHRSTAIVPVAAPSEADGAGYRRFVDFLRDEYHAVGAIMVSNASTLFEHTRQMFDEFDDDAELLGEIGVVIRTPGTLTTLAPAKRAAQQAYEQLFGEASNPAEALIIGATGPARALAMALSEAGKQRVCLTTLDGKSMTDMRQRIASCRRTSVRHCAISNRNWSMTAYSRYCRREAWSSTPRDQAAKTPRRRSATPRCFRKMAWSGISMPSASVRRFSTRPSSNGAPATCGWRMDRFFTTISGSPRRPRFSASRRPRRMP